MGSRTSLPLAPDALHLLHFAGDDLLDALGRDRLDVGAVGELRVGHDGGRVGVDEDDAVAFFLEGFAGLRAGVIELARLADDDRAGADDEDGMDVGALGHKMRQDLIAIPRRLSVLNFDQNSATWQQPRTGFAKSAKAVPADFPLSSLQPKFLITQLGRDAALGVRLR